MAPKTNRVKNYFQGLTIETLPSRFRSFLENWIKQYKPGQIRNIAICNIKTSILKNQKIDEGRTEGQDFAFGSQTTEFIFWFGGQITVLNFGFGDWTTVLNLGLSSPNTVLNFGLIVELQH